MWQPSMFSIAYTEPTIWQPLFSATCHYYTSTSLPYWFVRVASIPSPIAKHYHASPFLSCALYTCALCLCDAHVFYLQNSHERLGSCMAHTHLQTLTCIHIHMLTRLLAHIHIHWLVTITHFISIVKRTKFSWLKLTILVTLYLQMEYGWIYNRLKWSYSG